MISEVRNEIARGYILLGVFYTHLLYSLISELPDHSAFAASFIQIKLFAPHVSAFFFLSGMSSRGIGQRSFRVVASRSLMLLVLAKVSHIVGIIMSELIDERSTSLHAFAAAALKPIVLGVGYSTFIAWFFIVLAVVRMLAYLFERSKLQWLLVAGTLCLAVIGSQRLGLPDNIYEWRNWPAAFLFFVIGTRIPREWQITPLLGATALVGTLMITWLNGPHVLQAGLCWDCNMQFVAQPMVGEYGFIPTFLLQEILFLMFLLWCAQATRRNATAPNAALALPAKVACYFGRNSLQFLLLHGWVIVTIFPILIEWLLPYDSKAIFLALLIVNPLIHAGLFMLLKRVLDRVLAFCFSAGRWLTKPLGYKQPLLAG